MDADLLQPSLDLLTQLAGRPGLQLVGRQEPVNRGQAEGAGLERALRDELAHQHVDGQVRILLPPLQQRLTRFRAEGLAEALLFARSAMQRLKPLVAQQIIPALQRGGGIGFAARGPFAGQRGGACQREVLF